MLKDEAYRTARRELDAVGELLTTVLELGVEPTLGPTDAMQVRALAGFNSGLFSGVELLDRALNAKALRGEGAPLDTYQDDSEDFKGTEQAVGDRVEALLNRLMAINEAKSNLKHPGHPLVQLRIEELKAALPLRSSRPVR